MTHHDEGKEIQVGKRQDVTGATEQTRSGPVFIPAVDIFETEDGMHLEADMPGLDPEKISVDLRENTLTISGDISSIKEPGEKELLGEYEYGQFFRQFLLPDLVDQDKIDAQYIEGVLKLVLPKAEAAKPRKIEVRGI